MGAHTRSALRVDPSRNNGIRLIPRCYELVRFSLTMNQWTVRVVGSGLTAKPGNRRSPSLGEGGRLAGRTEATPADSTARADERTPFTLGKLNQKIFMANKLGVKWKGICARYKSEARRLNGIG